MSYGKSNVADPLPHSLDQDSKLNYVDADVSESDLLDWTKEFVSIRLLESIMNDTL